MIAHVCGLKTGDFIHTLGDAHIYKDHIEPLKQQVCPFFWILVIFLNVNLLFSKIQRTPRPFPTLNIRRNVTDIDQFEASDFELIGYNPYPSIKMEMSV